MTPQKSLKAAFSVLLSVQIVIVIIFAFCTKEELITPDEGNIPHFSQIYQMFTGILIMMLFGFGYLMTFLSKYGLGAVGFTMLITVLGGSLACCSIGLT